MLRLQTEDHTLQARFQALRPSRKLIIACYFEQKEEDQRSLHQIIPEIARKLGYKINVNNTNSFIVEVIKDFITE